jgi:hypothetical protein
VDWIQLAHDRDLSWALRNLWATQMVVEGISSLTERLLASYELHGVSYSELLFR